MERIKLGIIGGSGIYDIDGVQDGKWISVDTPFGVPSDKIFTGILNGIHVAFMPRHGRGHVHSPSNVPYRANICAMKSIGVTDLIALSACGSLREDMKPGEFVIVDQFIDRTFQRSKTFFDKECVAHVSVADPVCHRLGDMCRKVMCDLGLTYHDKGTYMTMEGPQFSTRAESILYKEVWNCDVIGMTNMPEAKLAREAEICYASIAMVTDFDCWHQDHDKVEVTDIIKTLTANAASAKSFIKSLCAFTDASREVCSDGCDRALENAIITDRTRISDDEHRRLHHIAGRVF